MADLLARLLAAATPRVEKVSIGGSEYTVRGMGPIQRSHFLQCMRTASAEGTTVPDHVIVALGLCSAEGIHDEAEQDAVLAVLRQQDGIELYKASEVVLRLSGFGKGAVEAAEKNSEPAGAPTPVPAGARTRNDRRQVSKRARAVRRR